MGRKHRQNEAKRRPQAEGGPYSYPRPTSGPPGVEVVADSLEVVPLGWIRREWGLYLAERARRCVENKDRREELRLAAEAVMEGVSGSEKTSGAV
jgi:hypothetical protein